LHTRREALLRSALEGVAFALRDAMSALVDEGIPVGDLRLVGGGSADARWRALLAAVLGRTLHVHEVPDVSVVGAARLAAAAVGAALPPATPVDPQMVDPQAAAAVRFDAIWQHWRSRRPVAASP